MAKIGIDYTAAIHQTAGVGRYVRELTAALADLALRTNAPAVGHWRLFVAGAPAELPPAPPGCSYAPSLISERNHARLWHRLRLPVPVEAWTGPIDLFHAADFMLPPTLPRTRTVLTVHDLAFEKYPGDTMPGMLAALRRTVPRSVKAADHVITVSEATRQDLIDLYRLPPEKVTAIPHGVAARFNPALPLPAQRRAVADKYHLPDAPFILTVGTLQPRKNHLRLVQSLARIKMDAKLVIAGGTGWAYDQVRAEVDRLRLGERVVFAGFIDDADLPDLYRAATIFAYPALYEGFGLPVLEAMACGLPVVASNGSSLPEVAGDAGLLVDPFDVDALADALARLLDDPSARAKLRQKGIARAGQFTWARAAERTWEVYCRLL